MFLLACLAVFSLASCDRFRGPQTPFDGNAAYAMVKTQVDFGPRVPGSPGWQKTGDWIVAQLKQLGDSVTEQRFLHVTPSGDTVPMRNIIAHLAPANPQRVLYITHWDTRPIAENDPVLGNRKTPIPGANDGASGVAMFIQIAAALKKTPPTVGVDLLFVDGEDYGSFDNYSDTASNPDVLIGSTYYARHMSKDSLPLYGVLWDMIGDKDLNINQEGNSVVDAPEVVSRVWDTAKQLGYGKYFLDQRGETLIDDHVPFLDQGVHVIDVIDYDYGPKTAMLPQGYHHTLEDTPDKVSAKSLQIVGDVAVKLVTGS
ncbi:MAG TPA: M28 family peptidase [Gemmatimonadaceae bacterium]|nr:M28 family peptidase [Gemmatimonadaceae bacterium]